MPTKAGACPRWPRATACRSPRSLADQHFTEPPPRYSEASLVKALEEYGIGRPSTYASIIQTLLAREYVYLDSRRFRPTDVGRVVAKFLGENFSTYVDYDFTAKLEDELDAVSRGEEDWIPLMGKFWGPFKAQVDEVGGVSTPRPTARELGFDPATSKRVVARLGRYGPMAQIGTTEDGDTPKFASLRPGQSIFTIELADALELFKLPRVLGAAPDGEEISTAIGRFGPFVKHGKTYASLKPGDDAYTIELPRALELSAREGRGDRQPHHRQLRRRRDPGPQRQVRPLHHRREQERQDSRRTASRAR